MHLDAVKVLLKMGFDINVPKTNGIPALGIAAYNGDLETVKILLENKCDINFITKTGSSALNIAIKGSHSNVI